MFGDALGELALQVGQRGIRLDDDNEQCALEMEASSRHLLIERRAGPTWNCQLRERRVINVISPTLAHYKILEKIGSGAIGGRLFSRGHQVGSKGRAQSPPAQAPRQ